MEKSRAACLENNRRVQGADKTSITIGICGLSETMQKAEKFLDDGWEILKIKGGNDVDSDIARMKALRNKFGSKLRIRFDANQDIQQKKLFTLLKIFLICILNFSNSRQRNQGPICWA